MQHVMLSELWFAQRSAAVIWSDIYFYRAIRAIIPALLHGPEMRAR